MCVSICRCGLSERAKVCIGVCWLVHVSSRIGEAFVHFRGWGSYTGPMRGHMPNLRCRGLAGRGIASPLLYGIHVDVLHPYEGGGGDGYKGGISLRDDSGKSRPRWGVQVGGILRIHMWEGGTQRGLAG